jgi:hypothetical protein
MGGSRTAPTPVPGLALAMIGVLQQHTTDVRRDGVMLALEVRGKVSGWLVEHPDGATADDIAAAPGYDRLTVRPRVSELYKLRQIEDSGVRRKNASGKSAAVWMISRLSSVIPSEAEESPRSGEAHKA